MGFLDDLGIMADDDLEIQVCGWAAQVAVLTARFILGVAEYDRRRLYERWECRNMAAWLSWKCGVAPQTAREYVRVGRALMELPRLRAEFVAGGLSYSQARAISRAATAASEAVLVEWAKVSTASQLERITRAYRRCRSVAETQQAARHAGRHFTYSWDEEGNLVGRFSLPAEAGAVLRAAIETLASTERISQADTEGAQQPWAAAAADALIELIAAGAETLACGDDRQDSRYLVQVVAEPAALQTALDNSPGDGPEADGDEGVLCQLADGPGLAPETARRLACDADIIPVTQTPAGDILDLGRRRRKINRALRRALQLRDQGCVFPGCDARRTHAHHITHWADGGPTNLANMASLCSRHHHRLHEGHWTITRDNTGQLRIGRPDGTEHTPGANLTAPPPDWTAPQVAPFQSQWDGTRLDNGQAIEILLHQDGLHEPPQHHNQNQNHQHCPSEDKPLRQTA